VLLTNFLEIKYALLNFLSLFDHKYLIFCLLILYLSLPQLKLGKNFIFILQEIYSNLARKTIGGSHEILGTTQKGFSSSPHAHIKMHIV